MTEKSKKVIFLSSNIILFLLIFLLVGFLFLEKKYEGKIYPNIYVAGIEISGLTEKQAEKLISQKIDNFEQQGLEISLDNHFFVWHNFVYSAELDLVSQTLVFDIEKSVEEAYLIGRDGNFKDILTKINLLVSKKYLDLSFLINQEDLFKVLEENFIKVENFSREANLIIVENLDSNTISFEISSEKFGQNIDFVKFLTDLNNRVKTLRNDKIELNLKEREPIIKKDNSLGLNLVAEELLNLAPFNLNYINEDKVFEVSKLDFAKWLALKPKYFNNKFVEVIIGLEADKVYQFLDEKVKMQVEREPLVPDFKFNNDKVIIFNPGKDGLKINYESTFLFIEESFNSGDMTDLSLVIEIDPVDKVENFNDMGIKEVIGIGFSNFVGSSANRRHNIKVGSDKLNGLIIKPGEEFSLVKALGDTNKEAGYLPELVIKGNKTIPEYGGGLCQVATTLFRTALNSGLPITERRNHSYRVSYYEPAGTDAAIYSPHPDLKFINDTQNNILIQARFEDLNDMYFDFWGTSDGRIVTSTYPVIYNIVRPGPTQIIETTELAPGKRKCTERAHSGAETYFDYTVIYNPGLENENKVENRFYSKYVPWREVCLVGVEAKIEEVEAEEAETEEVETVESSENPIIIETENNNLEILDI